MRMKLGLVALFLLCITSAFGQELRVDFGYSNLHSKQFDHLIRTNNFSRPFLENQQPFLSHGFHSGFSCLFKSEQRLSSGICLGHGRYSSYAQNERLEVQLVFNMMQLGYLLHFEDAERYGDFYAELGVNAVGGMLRKNVDDELFVIEDETIRSFHIGASAALSVGCLFELNDRLKLSPFAGIQYSPYFSEGESEMVINQTTGLLEESYNSFFSYELGFRLHIGRK